MLTTTYLTVDELKDYTPISANVDVTLLENWINVAEEMHINQSVLGTALNTALKTELEATGTLSGNNYTLLEYIQNASAWLTYYESIGFLRVKTANKGLTMQSSQNSDTVGTDDYKIFKQEIWDKCQYYRNRLIDYLNNNHLLFPLYRSDINNCDNYSGKDSSSGVYCG